MEGSLLSLLGVGVVVFASTNVDDIFLLSAFFADPHFRPRAIVLGQLLGIGTMVGISGLAALAAIAVPDGYTALLGAVPLLLGARGLLRLHARGAHADSNENALQDAEHRV